MAGERQSAAIVSFVIFTPVKASQSSSMFLFVPATREGDEVFVIIFLWVIIFLLLSIFVRMEFVRFFGWWGRDYSD